MPKNRRFFRGSFCDRSLPELLNCPAPESSVTAGLFESRCPSVKVFWQIVLSISDFKNDFPYNDQTIYENAPDALLQKQKEITILNLSDIRI